MKPLITVFTATYNRGYILEKLYLSLCEQTSFNFEWLIIDDGSIDDTSEKVDSWRKKENPFEIRYKKKKNGGKPRAINDGITLAQGRYFFIVDSDDYLLSDAIEKLEKWIKDIDKEESFIGVGAAKGYPNMKYIKGSSPYVNSYGYVDATNLERKKYNLDADMCEAYKIEIFRKYPMAEWEGENFAPEQIALNNIALDGYKLRWHNDIIYICEYLPDGLTKGSLRLEKNNPMGYAMMYNHKLLYNISFKEKIHACVQHIALSLYGKNIKYIFKSNIPFLTIVLLPLGFIIYIRRCLQYKGV